MAPLLPTSDVSAHDVVGRLVESARGTHIKPSRTLSDIASKVLPRQATTTVVSDTDDNAAVLSGGAIAGIVIGSIAGFLLLLWIIRSCVNLRQPPLWGNNFESEHEKVHHHRRHSYPYRHETHGSRSRSRRSRYSRSPGRSRSADVARHTYYDVRPRSKSPRVPPTVYTTDARDLQRASVASSHHSGGRRYRY